LFHLKRTSIKVLLDKKSPTIINRWTPNKKPNMQLI